MARIGPRQRLFASQLAGAIDRQRGDRILFGISAVLLAVEDEIGRDMDHRQPVPRRRQRHMPRAAAIDRIGHLRLALGLVDGGIGGGVDDDAVGHLFQSGIDRQRIGDIDLRSGQEQALPSVLHGEGSQGTAKLSVRTDNDQSRGRMRHVAPQRFFDFSPQATVFGVKPKRHGRFVVQPLTLTPAAPGRPPRRRRTRRNSKDTTRWSSSARRPGRPRGANPARG